MTGIGHLNVYVCCLSIISIQLALYSETNRNSLATSAIVTQEFLKVVRPDLTSLDSMMFDGKTDSTNNYITYPIGHGREATTTINILCNSVVSFSAFKNFYIKQYSDSHTNLSDLEIIKTRDRIISDLKVNTNSLRLVFGQRFKLFKASNQEMVKFLWQHEIQGFIFKDDYLALTFDSRDGELLALKMAFGKPPKSLKSKIDLETAKKLAEKYVLERQSQDKCAVTSAKMWIVTPNTFLDGSSKPDGARRLAWVLNVSKHIGENNSIEVWIDAETGEFLGGAKL